MTDSSDETTPTAAATPEAVLVEPATVRNTSRPAAPHRGGIRRIFAFIGWVFSGFGLIPALMRRGGRERREEITVYSAHKAFNLWALILTGFVGAWAVYRWPESPTNLQARVPIIFGWIYIWVLLYTFITLVFDVGTFKLLLWAGIFMFIWLIFRYVQVVQHKPILSNISAYFRGLHPKLDPGLAIVVSWLLMFPWVGSLFLTFTNGRKKFTPNEISEWQVGEGSELTDRAGLKFRTRYRDVLEMVLGFGAGDLLAFDNQQHVVKRYENVLFLIFLWPRLDDILHERSAIFDNTPDEPLQVEERHRSPTRAP